MFYAGWQKAEELGSGIDGQSENQWSPIKRIEPIQVAVSQDLISGTQRTPPSLHAQRVLPDEPSRGAAESARGPGNRSSIDSITTMLAGTRLTFLRRSHQNNPKLAMSSPATTGAAITPGLIPPPPESPRLLHCILGH